MKRYSIVFIIVTMLFGCNSSQKINGLDKKEKQEGWQILFDGKTTSGWHKYGGGQAGESCKVNDGILSIDPSIKDGGDLVTDKEFENFHLKLEWKISEKGNSGIIFLIHESTQYKYPWETGLEMQVLDNDGHADGKIIKHHAGDLFDLIACSKETVRPVGEWNEAEVKCINGKLDLLLNGVNVVSTTLWNDNWKKLISESKFKSMPGFGTYKKGHIALQDHGDKVSFRNIRIREY